MKQLAQAIVAVMNEVKGIDKAMTVGTGANAYKGVSDKDVKSIIGKAMEKNGLCVVPKSIEPTTRIDRWEETYNGQAKQKQQVFTEVKATYTLIHTSGETIDFCGYGHGVDTQDKSAGKATTYALKNALLYLFLVPTGSIDDTDAVHSDQVDVPKTIGLSLTGCLTASDLNAYTSKHWISKMDDEQRKELWAHAKSIGANYDKTKKQFV